MKFGHNIGKGPVEEAKQMLVDQLFGTMVEMRVALPVVFFGQWDAQKKRVSARQEDPHHMHQSIIEILLLSLVKSSKK